MNKDCTCVSLFLALLILVFSFLQISSSKLIIIIAAVLILLKEIAVVAKHGCSCKIGSFCISGKSGEEVSTREIKKILQDCIDNEEKRKPLTDDKLAAILQEKGYQIARRTVAKYREQLNIPVARMRKEL